MLCFSVKMQCFPNNKKKKVCSFVFIINIGTAFSFTLLDNFFAFNANWTLVFCFFFFYSGIFGF